MEFVPSVDFTWFKTCSYARLVRTAIVHLPMRVSPLVRGRRHERYVTKSVSARLDGGTTIHLRGAHEIGTFGQAEPV